LKKKNSAENRKLVRFFDWFGMNGGVIGNIDVQYIHGYGRGIVADQNIKPG